MSRKHVKTKHKTKSRPATPKALAAWSPGTLAAKASELCRRLKVWHLDNVSNATPFVSDREARRWVRRTFRDVVEGCNADSACFPKTVQCFFKGESDMEAIENPAQDTDRVQTKWLMADFLRHLEVAPLGDTVDYLKGCFEQILDVPAWCIREAEVYLGTDQDGYPRRFMVIGAAVPAEQLNTFAEAAKTLPGEGNTPAEAGSGQEAKGQTPPAEQSDHGFTEQWPLGMRADLKTRRVKRDGTDGAPVDLSAKKALWDILEKLSKEHPKRIPPAALERDGSGDTAVYANVTLLRTELSRLNIDISRSPYGLEDRA